MTEIDPRLGRITPEEVTFPAFTVNGNPFERYMSTQQIGGGYFVALDTWGAPDVDELARLKTLIAPKSTKGKHGDQGENAVAESDAGETGDPAQSL